MLSGASRRGGRGCDHAGNAGLRRYQILNKAARLMLERKAEFARIVSLEEGKPIKEAMIEASRAAETMELSAEEAKRLGGEVLPLDGASNGAGKFGFTLRVPVRRGGGHYAVQFSAESALPQSRAGAGGGQCRGAEAGQRHAAGRR